MSPEHEPTNPASVDGGDPAAASRAQQGGAAVDAFGGEFSNTPPSITKCLGSEDWIEQVYYLDHRDFAALKRRFDAARDASESNVPGGDELEIAGRRFLMQPSGAMAGSKGKQVAYRWRLRSEDGWWLLLMNRSQPHETMPNGIVRASSLPLLRLGSLGYLQQVEETLDDLRIRLVREKLSRVDPCADLSGLRIDGLYQAFMQGHFVSRARYTTNHIAEESYEGYRIGRKPTGFEFGKGGAVGMRVYDKARKCSGDSEMLLLMQTRRWGDVGGWATRAEFELRREKLKALGVDSIAQWWEKRGSICEYLAHKWCRITAEEVDSRHADRAATHPDWVKFQDAFKEWAGQPVAKLEPLTRLPVRADHLLSQIVGSLVSYYARVGTRIDSNESFVEESIEKIFDSICDRDMPREVWRRALELGAPRQ